MGQSCGKLTGPMALLDAVQHNNHKRLRVIVNSGTSIDTILDDSGRTACTLAVQAGNTSLVQLCFELQANPHTEDALGVGLLSSAAASGNSDVLKLVSKGFGLFNGMSACN